MRLQRWGAPIALAMVVAVVVAGAVWLSGGGGAGSSANPPLLRLMSASGGERAGTMSAADSTQPASSGAAYKLVGTLPDGTPADQPIYRLADPTADDVTTVARALGMTGDPQRIDGGWAVRDDGDRLWVRDDGGWSYGPDCDPNAPDSDSVKGMESMCAYAVSSGVAVAAEPPAAPTASPMPTGDDGDNVSSRDEDVTCTADATECSVSGSSGSASSGGTEPDPGTGSTPDCPPDTKECAAVEPPPAPLPAPEVSPGPSEADARAAADKVLAALGMSDARVTVWPGDPTASVQANPRVQGLDTVGLGTYLQVDGNGDITWADGRLPGVIAGAAYPVISAQTAFDKLLDTPQVAIDMCMVREDGEPGCAELPPAEVTGGALGLLLDYDGERPVLVPAWLFDVKGQPEPAAQIAIDPSFLAPPAPVDEPKPMPVDDGTGTGTGGGEDPKPMPPEEIPVEGGGAGSDGSTGTAE